MAVDKSRLCNLAYDRRCDYSISPFYDADSAVETDCGILAPADVQELGRLDRDVKQRELTKGGEENDNRGTFRKLLALNPYRAGKCV